MKFEVQVLVYMCRRVCGLFHSTNIYIPGTKSGTRDMKKNGTQLHPLEIRNREGKTWENTIEWPVRTEVLKAGFWLYFVCCCILGPRISPGTHRGSINICGIKNLRNDNFYPIIRLFLDMISFSHFLVYLHICEPYIHFTAS